MLFEKEEEEEYLNAKLEERRPDEKPEEKIEIVEIEIYEKEIRLTIVKKQAYADLKEK